MGRLITVIVLAGALAACSSAKDMSAAEGAVNAFHQELDAGQFEQIYQAGGPELRSSTPEPKFIQFLAAVHRKLGPVQSASAAGWHVNYTTGGSFVSLDYKTSYKGGEAQENFTFRMEKGAPQLIGYHINSDALIMG